MYFRDETVWEWVDCISCFFVAYLESAGRPGRYSAWQFRLLTVFFMSVYWLWSWWMCIVLFIMSPDCVCFYEYNLCPLWMWTVFFMNVYGLCPLWMCTDYVLYECVLCSLWMWAACVLCECVLCSLWVCTVFFMNVCCVLYECVTHECVLTMFYMNMYCILCECVLCSLWMCTAFFMNVCRLYSLWMCTDCNFYYC